MSYVHPEYLVDTEWVAAHLDDPNVRIIESDEDPLLYAIGHIPGAVQVDWFSTLQHPLRRDFLTKEKFEEVASRLGIKNEYNCRFLRRQVQLVRLLCLVALPVLRPSECQDHERRAPEVGAGESSARQGSSVLSGNQISRQEGGQEHPRLPRSGPEAVQGRQTAGGCPLAEGIFR